jgi:hypothetical protein
MSTTITVIEKPKSLFGPDLAASVKSGESGKALSTRA